MDELALDWDLLLLDACAWPTILNRRLQRLTRDRLRTTLVPSHNTSQYLTLHSCPTLDSATPPFHVKFRNFNAVLLLRLQLAPIATMHHDNATAQCHRCSLSPPDTIDHWLFHCPLFSRQRNAMTENLSTWADMLDNAITARTLTPQRGIWDACTSQEKISLLLGSLTGPGAAALSLQQHPCTFSNTSIPTNDVLHRRLVFITQRYCDDTFPAAAKALNRTYYQSHNIT